MLSRHSYGSHSRAAPRRDPAAVVACPVGDARTSAVKVRHAEPLWSSERGGALDDLLARPSWHRDAACLEHPEVDFFPERGEDSKPAKAVCDGCLVRLECLNYAIVRRIHGVWGGLSERERNELRKRISVPVIDDEWRVELADIRRSKVVTPSERLRAWLAADARVLRLPGDVWPTCRRGHPWTEENTRWSRDGRGRQCRPCAAEGARRRRNGGGPPYDRSCDLCGQSFEARTVIARWCSHRCAALASWRGHRNGGTDARLP